MKQRIAKLDGHIRKCFDLLMAAHAQYAILRPMMNDQRLLDRIGRANKNTGFDTIRFALYWSLVQELVKIVADEDCRVPSIYNFRRHFEDPQVKVALKEKFSAWPSSAEDSYPDEVKKFLRQSDEEDEKKRRQLFDSLYEKVLKESAELLNSSALKGMKTIRDKLLGHNELKFQAGTYRFVEPKDYRLKYGDEKVVLEKATLVFDDFFVLATQIYADWNEFKTMTKRDAEQFWKE